MTKLAETVLNSFLKGFSLDAKGKLKVLDEAEAKKARAALRKLVLEKSRTYWDMLESAEGSLANLRDEISFEEMNADPSRMTTQPGAVRGGDAAVASAGADAAGMGVGDVLGEGEDFDLGRIFEMAPVMDAEGQDDVVDGDEDFENLSIGQDNAGMGGDDMSADEGDMDNLDRNLSMDNLGDEPMDNMDGDNMDNMGDSNLPMDNMASDDMGDEMSINPEGDDEDFDFDFMGDESNMDNLGGDEFSNMDNDKKLDDSMGAVAKGY